MAPKRLRRAPASLLEDNDDEPAPGSPPQIDVNGLARAPAVERNTDQQQRTRSRTFASQTLVCNNLCDEAGVQKDSLYGNVLFTSTGMAWKGEYKRYSPRAAFGVSRQRCRPRPTAGRHRRDHISRRRATSEKSEAFGTGSPL